MGGFIKQALIRNLLCILIFPYQKLSNLCFCKHYIYVFWEISLFSLQKLAFGYFAKGILQNFGYFPTKFVYFISIIPLFVLYHVCVLSKYCIKLNFMPFPCLLSKLSVLWHFHFKMSKSMLYVIFCMFSHSKMGFASKNSHLVCVVYL